MRLSADNLEDKVLTFQVGSETYGIPLGWVCGIETAGAHDPGEEYRFRGSGLPVMDMRAHFGTGVAAEGSLLILGRSSAETAVLVDRPGTVVDAPEVYKLPDLCQNFVKGTFMGVIVRDGSLILMVDPVEICREGGGDEQRVAGGDDGI